MLVPPPLPSCHKMKLSADTAKCLLADRAVPGWKPLPKGPPVHPICHCPSSGSRTSRYDAYDSLLNGPLPFYSVLPCTPQQATPPALALSLESCPKDKCQPTEVGICAPDCLSSSILEPPAPPALPHSFSLAPPLEPALPQPPRWTLQTWRQSPQGRPSCVSVCPGQGRAGKHVDPVRPGLQEKRGCCS